MSFWRAIEPDLQATEATTAGNFEVRDFARSGGSGRDIRLDVLRGVAILLVLCCSEVGGGHWFFELFQATDHLLPQ